MNFLLAVLACLMVGGFFWTKFQSPPQATTITNQKSSSSSTDQRQLKVLSPWSLSTDKQSKPISNSNCQGNESPPGDPSGFTLCPLRDLKNNPEIKRQIDLMKDNNNFKSLHTASACRGCPVVTNSLGLPNIASLYFGGTIASLRDTVPFVPPASKCGSSGCLNIPESIIQPDFLKPGKNWHFKGEEGTVIIELTAPADITGFTVLHPTKTELPQGYFKSAPRLFKVFGLKDLDENNPHSLGTFEYKENGPCAQTFLAEHLECDIQFKFVEIRFQKNYGNPLYTAVYKIQVHGYLGQPWFDEPAVEVQLSPPSPPPAQVK